MDLDDLLDAAGVAKVLGLARRNSVSVYRGRYLDFPQPVARFAHTSVWLRQDVERWAARR